MLALMLGPPGGGKSYESVVYHVLPAIQEGRKVITNLPLNVDEFCKIEPRARQLIEFRNRRGTPGEPASWAFGSLDDYGDPWRDPATGRGPLYVIDECHKPLPRRGLMDRGGAPIDEWYAEHRHEGADVLLITQSYGKVSKNITDQIQVVYRVKKAVILGGGKDRYIRKVQDGTRGEVISTAERQYLPQYFPLYKSHTRTESAIVEADARDARPAFVKWRRAGFGIIGLGLLGLVYLGASSMWADEAPATADAGAAARTQEHGDSASDPTGASAKAAAVVTKEAPAEAASKTHRIVAVVTGTAGAGYAVMFTEDREWRFPLVHCHRDEFDGWICPTSDGFASMTTGPRPLPDNQATTIFGTVPNV